MENQTNILERVNDLLNGSDEKEIIYKKIIALLHFEINKRNIIFTPEFKEDWNISEENPMKFDDEFFEAGFYDELFVFYAAVVDEEIFDLLQTAYNSTHSNTLSQDNISEKIQSLLDGGIWALWLTEYIVLRKENEDGEPDPADPGKIYRRRFFYVKDDHFEILTAQGQYIDDETVQISVTVDAYGLYNTFEATTKKIEEYKEISQYVWNKKFDKLFELVRTDLDQEISDWLSKEKLKN